MRARGHRGRPEVLRWLRWVVLIAVIALLAIRFHAHRDASGRSAPGEKWTRLPSFFLPSPIELAKVPEVVSTRFPLGTALGAFSYNARSFREDRHLGDDWNGIGGGNSDLGDPARTIGSGRVLLTRHPRGGDWGGMVMVGHRLEDGSIVASFYGHLDRIHAIPGQQVDPGRPVGTVGTGNGLYLAHLHLEIRQSPVLWEGAGYSLNGLDRLDPTAWIEGRLVRGTAHLVHLPTAGGDSLAISGEIPIRK